MAMTIERLKGIPIERDRAKFAHLTGQVIRTGHSDGKRTAEVYSRQGVDGAVGMSGDATVCRNLKTARRKRPMASRYVAPPAPEARYVHSDGRVRECGSTSEGNSVRRDSNDERMVALEMLFGKNHPRVVAIRQACGIGG